uniref:serine/arginine repetitive matrix protein 2-like isoform X2 n=1 Tax=Styela clava TaxID=7725 RepID=UPI00193A2E57|nr:serine/arginine repetitive matrix protein 2-like isoform X2 [Styela clava]
MKNMRVTVCFGQTRVIVPCKGGATVAELVKEACARYKKAIGKTPKYRVKIRQLENAVDGGILDTDDYVFDVAEDRDQLIAIFEEEDNQTYHYNGWDRHSGSGSDGHRSPLSFQHHSSVLNSRFGNDNTSSSRNRPLAPTGNATVIKHNSKREQNLEVNVGVDALKAGPNSHITVRRESEQMLDRNEENIKNIGTHKSPVSKNLNHYYERQVSGGNHLNEENLNPSEYHKQIMITTANSSPDQNVSVVTASSDTNNSIDSGHHSIKTKIMSQDAKNYGNFTRGKMRQSKMGMLSENYDDLPEDKYRYSDIRQPPEGRKEVTSNYADFSSHHKTEYTADRYLPPSPKDSSFYPDFYNDTQEMFVDVDNRPLGVQVMSFMDRNIFCGLLVESVDEGGRSEREELLREGDVIVEINNYVLAQYTLHIAQEIFKNAMKFSELQLRVYPIEERERATLEVPGSTTVEINNALNRHRHTPSIPTLSLVEATPPKASKISAAKSLPDLTASSTSKIPQNVSPVGKIPLAARMSLDTLSNNTRKIGNMLEISLRKGEQGLGFSITTRDTSIGDAGPIYIKNILPKGAAIQDGRLHAGDRLLKVNDIDMTGYTQESAVSILRCIEVGSTVTLLVSRHVNTLPRKMKDDPDADKVLNDDSHREYFKFEIALNDTGSAGLGISLKGNQSKKTKRDLGIFVKSVFHGGAAYQDGRLQPNDQLVSVNGQSLIGMTNHEAIDTLRTSMSTVGNVRGMIQMVIARRKHTNGDPTSPNFSSEASSELSDSIINERTSRLSNEENQHHRQISMPTDLRDKALSPNSLQRYFLKNGINHTKRLSELSFNSSVLSTSLGDDAIYEDDEIFDQEIRSFMDNIPSNERNNLSPLPRSSRVISPERSNYSPLPRSSRVISPERSNYSPLPRSSRVISPAVVRRSSSMKRRSYVKTPTKEQFTFADTINRYTSHSASSPTSPQYKNIIGDLLRSAAIDNHYKPRLLTRSSTPSRKLPSRSHSMRAYSHKNHSDSRTTRTIGRIAKDKISSSTGRKTEKAEESPFDNITAFEITGSSRDENSVDDSYRYNEEIPEQIDPSPLDGYVNDENRKYSDSMTKNHDDDWMASPDPQDSGIDPFSRESIFRQSISEKRRGGDAANTDTFKALKNKQMNNGLEKKISSSPEPRSPTPKSPSLKWVKPTHTKNHSISSSSTTHSYTPKSPTRRSPRVSKRNLNNSSNLPGSQDAFTEENKRSHTPLSFDYRSTTPSSLSQLSQGSHHYASMTALNYSPLKPLNPSNYPTITETPKSSKNSIGHSYSSDPQSPVPVVRKSNSSDSLMTFGLYTKQPPPSPTYKTTSPNKSGTSRGVPYVKPPVLPYSDLKHLATCCTPVSLGPFTSPSYERPRHPLTARREPTHFEPEVDVGPTLGIAKSSSLESLQTAVENFVENKDAPYPKPQPRVLRGRVLNESFRAALDQSYDMENLSGKPMATLREEGTGISPLARTSGSAPTSGQRAHEKKRAGKSYKIFGIFRVGKNKRSQSSDRHLDSFSSNSSSTSSPRLPESEAHKKLLESKREDDFKKHQAENERIQAKAKLMREQQEQRKKDEKNKSREDLANSNHDDRVRAPSVPVTAMQRMNMDPKVTYSESHSGRRSVDPGVMLGSHSQTFEWNSPKRPTSPVDYGDRSRQRRQERNLNVNNIKTTPDYSSLPRQPRLESDAGALPDDPNRIMTHAEENDRMTPTAPHRGSYTQDRSSTGAPGNFNNYEFYNMQKPPSSKRRSAESKFRTNTSEHSSGSVSDRPSRPDKSKVGRTLYYDDTDDSLSRTTVQRSKTPQPQMRLHRDKSPHSQTVRPRTRPVSTINGLGLSPIGNSFHREESPEPPPVMYRSQKAERKAQSSGPYRHSVHVDVPVSRQYERHTTYHSARPRDRKEAPPTSYRWKTDLLTKGQDQSDTDSNRTGSPAHSENAERNRNAMKKMLKARYNEQQDSGKIVISPPYNL